MRNKELDILHETVSKLHSLISPMTYNDTLKDLRTKPAGEVFKGDFKKCIVPWKIGQKVLHLPICNRYGAHDPQMINLSKKMVNKYKSVDPQSSEGGEIVITKLDGLFKRYMKDSPISHRQAAKNGEVTKFRKKILANIKGHLT